MSGGRDAAAATRWRWLNWPLLAPSQTFEGVELFPHEDKIVHVGIFLVLAWLVRWSVPGRFGLGGRRLIMAALAVYAFSIETFQPWLTGGDRQFDWLDMACNYAGTAAGWALFGAAAARAAVSSTTGEAAR